MPDKTYIPSSDDLALLEALSKDRLTFYLPHPKQQDFHRLGSTHRERLFMAGNQQGKTLAGSAEVAMHLTGRYPSWWKGRRFELPTRWWVAGVTGESTRDNPQKMLMGPPGAIGTGMIPADAIVLTSRAIGVANLLDTVQVRHSSGGLSYLAFKFYEKGRLKWQGETLDGIWDDEEPPKDIYTEGLARTTATKGMCFITATPLLGMSDVVMLFYPSPSSSDRVCIQAGIEDALHIPRDEILRTIAKYEPWERDARVKGIPMLGTGRVFQLAEDVIKVRPFVIPDHWPRIVGYDMGIDHPSACAWIAHDRETDTIYVYDIHRQSGETIAMDAAAIRSRGVWIPVAWPHDVASRDKNSGKQFAVLLQDQGLNALPTHAQFEGERGSSVEAGVHEMLLRMQVGKFKVFDHLTDWFQEFRQYHRQLGLIVKKHDDLLCATRYGVMMIRFAETPSALDSWKKPLAYTDTNLYA